GSHIQRACCFVQNQQRRMVVKGASKADALALPARKTNTTFPHDRIKAVTHFRFDEVEYLCRRTRLAQSHRINLVIREAKRDVASDCVVYQKDVLWHVTDGSLPGGNQRRRKGPAIDQQLACHWLVKCKQQINQR